MEQGTDCRIEVTGCLDPHELEILQLEIRRLAKRYDAVVRCLRVQKAVTGANVDR